jgi:hypothetical protein
LTWEALETALRSVDVVHADIQHPIRGGGRRMVAEVRKFVLTADIGP